MTIAVAIENLGKRYVIGHERRERYVALRDVMMHKLRGVAQRLRHPLSVNVENTDIEEFWALKDINLEIREGDRVGIIGRNGAGKSTLLKVLSRITAPTTGRAVIRGRVASLLEVGTGFHPELTGRENIFLNGAILGMTRQEIKQRFDEIVAFAEVERFLDTPVKRFSSGMYVRLAFAVAAHLEPEILVIDEVLAVGDSAFQKKCLNKMETIGQEGRTVLFVSHNMAAIQQLTTSAVLLSAGSVSYSGETTNAVAAYLKTRADTSRTSVRNVSTRDPDINIPLFAYQPAAQPHFNCPLHFRLEVRTHRPVRNVHFAIGIHNSAGARLLTAKNIVSELRPGDNIISAEINGHRLPPGEYSADLGLSTGRGGAIFYKDNLIDFSISDENVDNPLLAPYLERQRDKIGAFHELGVQIEHDGARSSTTLSATTRP